MSTDLEVFHNTVNHKRSDRVLYHASFTPDLKRRVVERIGTEDYPKHFGMYSPFAIGLKRPAGFKDPDWRKYYAPQDLPADTWFDPNGVAKVPSGFYHFKKTISPLRNATSLSELESYPIFDVSKWELSHTTQQISQAHAEGKVVQGAVGHIYETAWQIRGYEEFLMDMIDRPEWAQCLLDRLARQKMDRAVAFAGAGADFLVCGDDIANQNGMMFAPTTWKQMMLCRWREIWQAVKAINPPTQIWYHTDGNAFDVVGDLIDAGVDILNPLQPECLDVDEVYRRYGKRVSFDGCMGTQSTMPFGKPADVRARVKEIIEKYGRNGGLIISPTHVLEPEVPIENIEAFCEAAREYGRLV